MATHSCHSNVASVVGSIADSSSDSSSDSEDVDESDSSDGLEVIEEMSTGKARDANYEENTNSNITVRSLLTVLKAPKQSNLARKRKVAIVDFGEPFVKATYRLEGNGPLALDCFEIIDSLSASIRLCNAPNVEAIAKHLAHGSFTAKQKWIDHAKTCIEPGHSYFKHQLTSSLKGPLQAFKAARLFSPSRLYTMKPDIVDVENLAAFPFLKGSVADLKQEFNLYVAKAADVNIDSHDEILKWWKQNTTNLPKWSSAAQKVFLVQPSSAASERAFSLLKASLTRAGTSRLHTSFLNVAVQWALNLCN